MEAGSFRFEIGTFECVSVGDGALNYPPESFFANVPLERVEEALRERDLPTAQITTPYTCLFIDAGEHRAMVDTRAGDLGAHAADVFPGLDHSTSVTALHAHPDHVGARWTRQEHSFSPTPTISSRKRSGISGFRRRPRRKLPL
jgi:hypothetical protein